MRKNKTQNSLKELWDHLDDACGSIDNATTNLSMMVDVPTEIADAINRIDFSSIVSAKNMIEEMIADKKEKSNAN